MKTFEAKPGQACFWAHGGQEYFIRIEQDLNQTHPLFALRYPVDIYMTNSTTSSLFMPWAHTDVERLVRQLKTFCKGPAWEASIQSEPKIRKKYQNEELFDWLGRLRDDALLDVAEAVSGGKFVVSRICQKREDAYTFFATNAGEKDLPEGTTVCGAMVSVVGRQTVTELADYHRSLAAQITEYLHGHCYQYVLYEREVNAGGDWLEWKTVSGFYGKDCAESGLIRSLEHYQIGFRTALEAETLKFGHAERNVVVTYQFVDA